jgi:hypothetical protein
MPSTRILPGQCKGHCLDNPSEPDENRTCPVGGQFLLPKLNGPFHLNKQIEEVFVVQPRSGWGPWFLGHGTSMRMDGQSPGCVRSALFA